MANEKFLFVDGASGFYTETVPAVDVFTGATSALVQTNGSGKIDNSLINFAAFTSLFEARAASNTNITVSAPGATIGAVTMVSGDRFLLVGQTTASENGIYVWNGAATPATRALDYDANDEISAGDLVIISEGTFAERAYILATNDPIVVGTTALSYTTLGTALIDAGNGLSYSGTTLNVNLLSGRGLEFVGDDIAVNPSDIAGVGTIEIANQLAVDFVVSGTNNNSSRAVKGSDLINFGANQGAKIIGYDNSVTSPYTSAITTQQAIDDAYAFAAAPGVLYTAGAGGIVKGQLVYVSANNTVLPHATLSSAQNAVGVAYTSATAGTQVRVVTDSSVILNGLVGATAGTRYYWNGTAYTSTIPATSGAHVWAVGTARNATDLHVKVEFVKKNN